MRKCLYIVMLLMLSVFAQMAQASTNVPAAARVSIDKAQGVYLYDAALGLYLNADGQYAQAMLSSTPLLFNVTSNGKTQYYIQPQGKDLNGTDRTGKDMKRDFYMDQNKNYGWVIVETGTATGKYLINESGTSNYFGVEQKDGVYRLAFTTDKSQAVEWVFLNTAYYAQAKVNSPSCESTTGWTDDANTTLLKVNVNAKSDAKALGFSSTFLEFWNGSGKTTKVYQTLSDMPAGIYRLTATVVDKNTTTTAPLQRAALFLGDNSVTFDSEVAITTSKTIYCRLAAAGDLKFGFDVRGGKEWLGIDDINLEYVGALNDLYTGSEEINVNKVANSTCADLQLTDGYDFANATEFTATKLSYNRSLTAGTTTTVCLPFALTADEAAGLGDFYQLTSANSSEVIFTKVTEGTEAYKPYVFVAKEGASFATYASKTIAAVPTAMEQSVTGAKLVGTMSRTAIQSGDNSVYAFNNGSLTKVSSKYNVLPAFRAYFVLSTTSGAKQLRTIFGGDGKTTNISLNKLSVNKNNTIYSLDGRVLNAVPAKGVYIMNGKKYINK
ncbi:MAG: hypothetical protein ACI4T9_09565 [Prevotella sp.]